jgi:HD-like signal output (HDOD) protein
MGLWAWVMEWLTQDGGPVEPDVRRTSGGSIATLERPRERSLPEPQEPTARWWAPEGATLVEPVEPPRPELTTEARALENLLISHFDGHDLKMPPLVQAAEQVLGRLRDPNCSLADVSRAIADDPVIAASVLRMTNSPLYRGLKKITALQPAVTRLGTKAVRTLMMHESLRAAVFQGRGRDEWAERIWASSRASALIMYSLSTFTRVNQDDAFLLGLLHDIGEVIVLRIVRGDQVRSHVEIDDDTFDYLCHECHQEFGELVAAAWNLPPTFRSLIADHHTYPSAEDPLRTERLQLHLCDMIAAMLGYAPPASYDLLNARAVRDLGLLSNRGDFGSFLARLPAELEEAFGWL